MTVTDEPGLSARRILMGAGLTGCTLAHRFAEVGPATALLPRCE